MNKTYFPRLTGGIVRDADRYTVGPETYPALWYDLKNLIAYKGRLQRREGVANIFNGLEPPDGNAATAPDRPLLIITVAAGGGSDRFVVVTSTDVYVGTSETSWFCVTPTYSAGQVTVTNGSGSVTGVGTAWVTRRIRPTQKILIEGAWYTILTVPSDTSLTMTPVFAGTSSPPNQNYSIRRIWNISGGSHLPRAFAHALSGDVYLAIDGAGAYQNPSTLAITQARTGAILKIERVADLAKTTFSSADTTILMSTDAMDAATSALGEAFFPHGLEILTDGRLVVPSHAQNKDGATPAYYIDNRVYYSSHTDLTNWTVSPAGFTDIITSRSGITASKRIGSAIAIHCHDQIYLATQTGADDPPLDFRSSSAHIGAGGPRLVTNVPAGAFTPQGQCFLAGDGHPYLFDGDQARPVPGWKGLNRDIEPTVALPTRLRYGFLNLDAYRRSVSFFHPSALASGFLDDDSAELRYDLDTGVASRHHWKNYVSAASEPRAYVPLDSAGADPYHYGPRIIGVQGTNSTGAATEYLYAARYEVLNDSALPIADAGGSTGGMLAETHDLILFDPNNGAGGPGKQTTISRIVIWWIGRAATTETLKCSVSKDAGANWTTLSSSETMTTAEDEKRADYFFDSAGVGSSEKWRIKIESNDNDVFSFALTRMLISWTETADAEALNAT